MPTSGTHITVVQRLAASGPALQALLGDPLADDTTSSGRMMRFANLGAVGPDVFYAMADYGSDLQDLENFLVKVGGTFECIGELIEKIDRYVGGLESQITFGISDSLRASVGLVSAVLNNALIALVVDSGFNAWPVFEPARQKDNVREKWFWADYLHYVRSGRFVRALLKNAKGNPNLEAYAYGYVTHYVTDVVGHPYVNQVVGAPWRLYWQRHHLVENFIDTYVWDRWHQSRPAPANPTTEEQPLDAVTQVPNSTGNGAPFTFSRLHDHIGIGNTGLGDPVDGIVKAVCDAIDAGTFALGIAEDTSMAAPTDADFKAWTKMMADTIREVYDEPHGAPGHPENLLSPSRPGGYPTAADVGAAYGAMRMVLKIATEEKIHEPVAPDIVGDISAAVQQLLDDLATNLGSFPPFPVPSTDGSFSWDSLWDAIKNTLDWAAGVAGAVAKTVFDFIRDAINVGGTILSEPIKYALYLLNKWLYSIYRHFRDVLVLAAYAAPFTDELSVNMGGPFNTASLWRSLGDPPFGHYPVEEIVAERDFIFSTYAPFRPPASLTTRVEQPPVGHTAPYRPTTGAATHSANTIPTRPDDFLDAPLGPDDMFLVEGPATATGTNDERAPHTFDSGKRNFGGAIANCAKGIKLAQADFPAPYQLPDYNLDGDRGYAWPTWDVSPAPTPSQALDPLSPTAPLNQPTTEAHVNAVGVTG